MNFLHDKGKLLRFWVDFSSFFFCASIEENIFLSWVAVHVDVHDYFFLFVGLSDQFSHVVYLWLKGLFAIFPFTI